MTDEEALEGTARFIAAVKADPHTLGIEPTTIDALDRVLELAKYNDLQRKHRSASNFWRET